MNTQRPQPGRQTGAQGTWPGDNTRLSDGTHELLLSGFGTLGFGLLAFVLLFTVLGGAGKDGAHNNAGWMALVAGMMSAPFGLLLALLGVAKWLRLRNTTKKSR